MNKLFVIAAIAVSVSGGPRNSYATCFDTNFELARNNKEQNIKTILAFGHCVKEEQKARVRKWFCYVSNMVGIQKQDDGQLFAGNIKPNNEKFFLTIDEVSDDQKQLACERGEY